MLGYDYLVVGCGISGVVFAQRIAEQGRKVLVIEKRRHIGGDDNHLKYFDTADEFFELADRYLSHESERKKSCRCRNATRA